MHAGSNTTQKYTLQGTNISSMHFTPLFMFTIVFSLAFDWNLRKSKYLGF